MNDNKFNGVIISEHSGYRPRYDELNEVRKGPESQCKHQLQNFLTKGSSRTLDAIPHARTRCGVTHDDYLFMFDGYLLVLRDDLTSKVELFHTSSAHADTMATALVFWRGALWACP